MTTIIYTSTCPGCGAQMPTPDAETLAKRYHPCPNCPPVNGRPKKWRAARTNDRDGGIHITYSDTRNSKQGLTEYVIFRVTPETRAAIDERGGDTWARRVVELAIDNPDFVI